MKIIIFVDEKSDIVTRGCGAKLRDRLAGWVARLPAFLGTAAVVVLDSSSGGGGAGAVFDYKVLANEVDDTATWLIPYFIRTTPVFRSITIHECRFSDI